MSTRPAPPPLVWGVVGPGAIARVFAESLLASGAGRVGRVCGRSMDRAASFCEEYGGVPAQDPEELNADPEVQALYVATPHSAHFEAAEAALRAGKAVLCEKPLTTSPAETERLLETARSRGAPLVEAWMYRTHPQIAFVLEQVRSGSLGRLRRVEARFGFAAPFDEEHRLFSPALGGGAILDIGGYPVSFALAVASAAGNSLAPELRGAEGELAPNGVDVEARAILRFENHLEAHLQIAITNELGCGGRVVGTHGAIELEDPFLPGSERHGRSARLWIETDAGRRETQLESLHDCFALEAFEVSHLIAKGSLEPRPPMVGHAETLSIARLLDSWRNGVGAHT